MWSPAEDADLRREAMAWLTVRTDDGSRSITSDDLGDFRFRGEPFRLMDRQRGITKPRQLTAALSIRTVWRAPGSRRPYEDTVNSDALTMSYKWRGDDPDLAENRGLRAAMDDHVPLIWFFGVGPGVYQAIFPVFALSENHGAREFVLSLVDTPSLIETSSPLEEQLRRYAVTETRRRLHQPIFRGLVMRAYGEQCAICRLRHTSLLDAAHIVPDRHEAGVAAVRNGLALCKIHHAAYDAMILGIRPDRVVVVRDDVLAEVDGPMLEHGLKALHRQPLRVLPPRRDEQPARELLEMRYELFRSRKLG